MDRQTDDVPTGTHRLRQRLSLRLVELSIQPLLMQRRVKVPARLNAFLGQRIFNTLALYTVTGVDENREILSPAVNVTWKLLQPDAHRVG